MDAPCFTKDDIYRETKTLQNLLYFVGKPLHLDQPNKLKNFI